MEVININQTNLNEHPGVICFINAKNRHHHLKKEWLNQRFNEGLRIKLLYTTTPKKLAGFIEYIPGNHAWRAVSAREYLFIHCIWVYPNKNKNLGYGTMLIDECIKEAKADNYNGVAVVTSKNAFMAQSALFLKNGFKKVGNEDKGDGLLALSFNKGILSEINDWQSKLNSYKGLHIVYTKQCPWVARMIEEIKESDPGNNLRINITELKTPQEAQNAPSLYATFNLIHDGKLLADRYISMTRFKNILKNEKLI